MIQTFRFLVIAVCQINIFKTNDERFVYSNSVIFFGHSKKKTTVMKTLGINRDSDSDLDLMIYKSQRHVQQNTKSQNKQLDISHIVLYGSNDCSFPSNRIF